MKKSILIISITTLLFAGCSKDYLDRSPQDSISPDVSFKSVKDLELFANSFYQAALPSAEGVYNEAVDNIVKTTLGDELTGRRIVPTSGGGWTWGSLETFKFF